MHIHYTIPKQTRPTAVALGAFDGLHLGHMALIRPTVDYAAANGLTSCVYTFEHSPSGAQYLTGNRQREALLRRLGVDALVLQAFTPDFRALSPQQFLEQVLIEQLNCAYVTAGFNFRFGHRRAGDVHTLEAFCRTHGIVCSIVPPVKWKGAVVSSTHIRRCVEEGDLASAAAMLGRWYAIDGVVETGDRLGRTIGFPTANLAIDNRRALPPRGVYASVTRWNDRLYPGITNFGGKPTVRQGLDLVETHLFDFSGDLYGGHISVAFVEKLRNIQPFSSLEALAAQLKADKERAWEILKKSCLQNPDDVI